MEDGTDSSVITEEGVILVGAHRDKIIGYGEVMEFLQIFFQKDLSFAIRNIGVKVEGGKHADKEGCGGTLFDQWFQCLLDKR